MYTAQLTIERIQTLIKEKKLTQKKVLSECGISENTLKKMTDNRGIASFSLARIADCLGCSVDFLLGRTDEPNINSGNNIKQSNIYSDNSTINVGTIKEKDALTEEFLINFNTLDFQDKVKTMNFVIDLKEK